MKSRHQLILKKIGREIGIFWEITGESTLKYCSSIAQASTALENNLFFSFFSFVINKTGSFIPAFFSHFLFVLFIAKCKGALKHESSIPLVLLDDKKVELQLRLNSGT